MKGIEPFNETELRSIRQFAFIVAGTEGARQI